MPTPRPQSEPRPIDWRTGQPIGKRYFPVEDVVQRAERMQRGRVFRNARGSASSALRAGLRAGLPTGAAIGAGERLLSGDPGGAAQIGATFAAGKVLQAVPYGPARLVGFGLQAASPFIPAIVGAFGSAGQNPRLRGGPVTRTAANRVEDYSDPSGNRYDGNSGRLIVPAGAITPSVTPIVQPPQRARNQALSNAAQNAGLPAWNWKDEENAAVLAAAQEREKAAKNARAAQPGGRGYITGENLPAVLDQSRADYWQAADMQKWAKANPELARRAQERAGYVPRAAQDPFSPAPSPLTADEAVLRAQQAGALDALPLGATQNDAILAAQTAGVLDAPITPAEEQRRRAGELSNAYLRGIQQQLIQPSPTVFEMPSSGLQNPSLGFSYASGRKFLRGSNQ